MLNVMSKLDAALQQFDDYNRMDPHIFSWDGTAYPQEYFFALKLYDWVLKLEPTAPEALLLASRSQHIGRWEIPRSSYPEGREAYLKWRKNLSLYHAEKASVIMKEVGYTDEEVARVKQIILKLKIKVDADVQTMENALCLVFLEFQYEEFHTKHPSEKVINILRKSLLKMDGKGHQFALTLNYSEPGLFFINEALKGLQ